MGKIFLMKITIQTITELGQAAKEFLSYCETGQRVFVFYGEMGVGKTTFIKAVCAQLGVSDMVSSPTYALVNEYIGENVQVFHLDLYRLKNIQEALDIGIEEYLYDLAPSTYCFIEWPQIIEPLLDTATVVVQMSEAITGDRVLIIETL